jgi:hypothetical protein
MGYEIVYEIERPPKRIIMYEKESIQATHHRYGSNDA